MQVELYCPHCDRSFVAPPEAPAREVLDRMADQGPWYALGDGETYEDMIFATLFACGSIRCGECGEPANVTEESLGQPRFNPEHLARGVTRRLCHPPALHLGRQQHQLG